MTYRGISHKFRKELQELCEEVGLDLVTIDKTKNNHIRFVVRSKHSGASKVFITGCTPSDRRGALNMRAQMKAFQRESTPA